MATNKQKGLLGVGLGILATGLLLLKGKQVEPLEPVEGEGAAIVIEVYDSEGNPVPRNSPMALVEGSSYTVVLTVKNISTKGGVAWPATLSVTIHSAVSIGYDQVQTLIPITTVNESFAAGQTKTFSYSLTVPLGIQGTEGQIGASVQSPTGVTLATAYEPLTIGILEIIYGATIVIG